jgi:molybdate transport system permease protein
MTPPTPVEPNAAPGRSTVFRIVIAIAAVLLLALIALPLVALLVRVPPGELIARLGQPVIRDALRLSLITTVAATLIVVTLGTPLAYLLATRRLPGQRAIEILVMLPMVLPPTVAGFALLMAFGRTGLVGRSLSAFGIMLPFTTLGVIVAEAFMAAPFYVLAARAGFLGVDRRLVEAARTTRASESYAFRRVLLPLALPGLGAGAAMAAARALGEFGATITFAGNLQGVTQTMPLAVYLALQSDLDAAVTLSVLLLVLSIALLIALRAAPLAWMGTDADRRRP